MSARLEIDGLSTAATREASLFELAETLGLRIPTSCQKNGKCRECLVEVLDGESLLSERVSEEAHLSGEFRLSCRARVCAEAGVVRCRTLRRGELRIEDSGHGTHVLDEIDPAVRRLDGTIFIDDEPVDESAGPLLGLAADIGTTTVVLRLLDLENGELLASRSFENPQRFGGSDVMARIHYDTEHRGRELQRTLLAYVSHAIEDFGCDASRIFELVVAGNSTMRDLFFGIDVRSIGQRPYRSITEHDCLEGRRATTSLTASARSLRLPLHPRARVFGLPLVSGHVGADTSACLLAIGMIEEERLVALMDIGTNTELVVGNRHRLLAASCPAGPAFEGGGVSCGMPALEGAIESLRIVENGEAELAVIGGGRPLGICGSGIVDLLAALLGSGRMNELGRLAGDDVDRFVIDRRADVALHESDISELAQAKGANVAGLRLVLERFGVRFAELDRFYLAGGFARHIDIDAARRIGLVPDLDDERIVKIGNASIEGATIAVLSRSRRQALEALVRGIEHVELETHESFFDHFVDGCQFFPVRDEVGR